MARFLAGCGAGGSAPRGAGLGLRSRRRLPGTSASSGSGSAWGGSGRRPRSPLSSSRPCCPLGRHAEMWAASPNEAGGTSAWSSRAFRPKPRPFSLEAPAPPPARLRKLSGTAICERLGGGNAVGGGDMLRRTRSSWWAAAAPAPAAPPRSRCSKESRRLGCTSAHALPRAAPRPSPRAASALATSPEATAGALVACAEIGPVGCSDAADCCRCGGAGGSTIARSCEGTGMPTM